MKRRSHAGSQRLRNGLAAGFVLIAAISASAEEPRVLAPAAEGNDPGAEFLGDLLRVSDASPSGELDAAEPVEVVPDANPGRGGRWRAMPHLDLRGTYDDNIFIRPDHKTDDYIGTASPGLALGYWDDDAIRSRYLDRQRFTSIIDPGEGNFWFADYTAILLGFAKTTSQNSFDQDGLLQGRWRGEKLTLAGTVHLESKSETNTEVGGRIRRKTLTAELAASYQKTEKTTVGVVVHERANDPQDFVQTVETSAEAFLDYAPTPLVRFGFSTGAGVVNVQAGADQVFERLLARASYSLTEKLEAELRGGVEFRQSSGLAGDQTNPIFELRATWTPAAATHVTVDAFRRVETSIERPEQNITFTGFEIRLHRQLRGGLHGFIEGGYEISDYSSTPTDGGRNDGYYFIRPGLLYNFAEWGNATLSYEHRENDSSQGSTSFVDNQTSVQVSLSY